MKKEKEILQQRYIFGVTVSRPVIYYTIHVVANVYDAC